MPGTCNASYVTRSLSTGVTMCHALEVHKKKDRYKCESCEISFSRFATWENHHNTICKYHKCYPECQCKGQISRCGSLVAWFWSGVQIHVVGLHPPCRYKLAWSYTPGRDLWLGWWTCVPSRVVTVQSSPQSPKPWTRAELSVLQVFSPSVLVSPQS